MRHLRAHIERIVHPIRATEGRKDRMREELLAHLSVAVAEERARGAGDTAATQRAIERLGEPDAVRRELQDSVPAWERALFRPLPFHDRMNAWDHSYDRREGESVLRHAARVTLPIILCIVLWLVVVAGFVVTTNAVAISRGREPRPFVPLFHFAGVLFGSMALLWFLCTLCISRFRQTMASPMRGLHRRAAAALWCLAGTPITLMCGMAAHWAGPAGVNGMPRPLTHFLPVFLLCAAAMPFLIYVVGRYGAEQQKRFEEWQSLIER